MRILTLLVVFALIAVAANKLDKFAENGLLGANDIDISSSEQNVQKATEWAKRNGPVIANQVKKTYEQDVSPVIADWQEKARKEAASQ